MTFIIVVFVLALLGIGALFALKRWEMKHEQILFPVVRMRFDEQVLRLKELLGAARVDLAKVPPQTLRIGRILLHEAALGLAVLARFAERQAHRLADVVSYKHRFEKRETRSEFLKKVSEHKNGGGQGEADRSAPELSGSGE